MMDVGDTSHGHEWHVVQEPSEHRVQTSVVNLVNVGLRELLVATLPADCVPNDHEAENTERGSGHPVDERISEEEVLDNRVVPATHTKTDIENGPLPEV